MEEQIRKTVKEAIKDCLPVYAWAQFYLSQGISVIPLSPRSKIPSIKSWKEYQSRLPTEHELQKWFLGKDRNLAIVTGKISNLVVVDLDSKQAIEFARKHNFPDGPAVRTSRGGHIYYNYKDGVTNFQKRPDLPDIDLRGEGGYVVAPPSIHESGHKYEWLPSRSIDQSSRVDPPDIVIAPPNGKKPINELLNGVGEGSRNDSLARLTGHWLGQGLTLEECLEKAREWNLKNDSPLADDEVTKTVQSIHTRHEVGPTSELPSEWNPDLPNLPVLSDDALYGLAGEFVRAACANSEADPAAVLATFLVRFGAEVGPDIIYRVGETSHYARLFSVIVGASAIARKGTSAAPVKMLFSFDSFLHENEPIRTAREVPGPFSSGEGVIEAVKDPVVENIKGKMGPPSVQPGVMDKRLFIQTDEFGSALACTKREGNTLSTVIRSAWDHGNLHPLTKNQKIQATNAHICIVAHITVIELKAMLNATEIFNGFANRFLWIFAQRTKLVPFPEMIPEADRIRFQKEIIDRLGRAKHKREIMFSPNAKGLWMEMYPKLSDPQPGQLGCIINRAEAQVVRLSLIYCLLDGASTINEEHLKAALAMWNYSKESARFIFGDRQENSQAELLLQSLKENGPMTTTQIYKLYNNSIPKGELKQMLNHLQATRKIILRTEITSAKKPTKIIELVDPKA